MSTEFVDNFVDQSASILPFPGLRPFEFHESHLFFGRDGQSEHLIHKLGATRFLAVVGTSGSGKSSLVRAGLLPSLLGGFMTSAGSDWRIAVMRPGNDPIGNLAQALNGPDVFGSDVDENAALQTVLFEATLQRGSRGLIDAVRQAVVPENENLLVVVDQFEEIFRFARVSQNDDYRNEAAAFVKLLLEATRQRELPIYVVLTMRSDYLGDCSQFWGLPEAINESQYLIPRLTRDQLKEAMSGPISVAGGEITPRLVARLLNDVGEDQDQLPVLQHLLMRMWDEWQDKRLIIESTSDGQVVKTSHKSVHKGKAIDLCCYDAVGGMSHSLSRHADEALNELSNERSREVAEKLFKSLTEKGTDNREIRRPATLVEICAVVNGSEEEVVAVVETFRKPGRSFLMPPADKPLKSDSLIDISHESLIRAWGRLKEWVEEESRSARIYRRLADTAVLHKTNDAGLYRDPDLQIALAWRDKTNPNQVWAKRYHPEFDLAVAFLDQSVQERDRETREKEKAKQRAKSFTRLRWMVLVFGVLLLVAAAALFSAVKQTRRANLLLAKAEFSEKKAKESRDEADTERKKALDSAALATEQSRLAEGQRKLAELRQKEALDQKIIAEQQAAKIAILERMSRRVATQEQDINTLTRQVSDDLGAKNVESAVANANKLLNLYRGKGHARGEYESETLLASAYLQLDKYDEARQAAKRALELQQNQQIDDTRGEHDNLAVLRDAYLEEADKGGGVEQSSRQTQQLLQDAFSTASQALRVQEGAVGATSQTLIPDLASLATISDRRNQHAGSERYRERILEVQRKAVVANQVDLAIYIRELAESSQSRGDYDKAVARFNEVLAIQQTVFEPKHPQVVATLNSLASAYRAAKNEAEADRVVQRVQKLLGSQALLRKGATGPEVSKLQQQLQKLGFFRGTVDQYFGESTTAAVIEFQQSQGLQADGVVGQATTSLLASMERLQPQTERAKTLQLQTKLKELGFYSGTPDGSGGMVTKAALTSFQRSKGLREDGTANAETLAALGLASVKSPAATGKVTVEIVAKMFPSEPVENIKANLPVVLRALEDANLTDKDMVLLAISVVGIETPDFEPYTELNSAFNTSSGGYAFDLYDNRKELGNQGAPDGERFKGRGYTSLTGRANYKRYGEAIGLGNQLVDEPELANDPAIAAKILVKYLQDAEQRLRPALAQQDLVTVRRILSGGRSLLSQFVSAYNRGQELVQ